MSADCAMTRWVNDMCLAGEKVGRPVVVARFLKQIYEEVGFVDVKEKMFKIPTNSWPRDARLKELGRLWESNYQSGLSGFTVSMFNRAFGRSAEETEVSLPPLPHVLRTASRELALTYETGCFGGCTARTVRHEDTRLHGGTRGMGAEALPRRGPNIGAQAAMKRRLMI